MKDSMHTEGKNMKIAVLSGKGGTGKTLVSVNLAAAAEKTLYIDCDVEEPNGHLFFKPEWLTEKEVKVRIPEVNQELCDGCRKCVAFCNFNALAYVKDKLIVFDDVCHSCGGCLLVCPQKALREKEKSIGKIQKGTSGNISINTGILNTGEATGVPIIKELLEGIDIEPNTQTIIDCPPGSACIVMESIKDADYCILVAEPTLFGAHNLAMVYELVTLFNKPFGVILNKCMQSENPSEKFCFEKNIKILGRIPFDNELGKLNSDAKIAVYESEKYRNIFTSLLEIVMKEVQHEAAVNPQR